MVASAFMEKAELGREILPCQAPDCDISTNKRYHAPGGQPLVACTFEHAERAYLAKLKDIMRQERVLVGLVA